MRCGSVELLVAVKVELHKLGFPFFVLRAMRCNNVIAGTTKRHIKEEREPPYKHMHRFV